MRGVEPETLINGPLGRNLPGDRNRVSGRRPRQIVASKGESNDTAWTPQVQSSGCLWT